MMSFQRLNLCRRNSVILMLLAAVISSPLSFADDAAKNALAKAQYMLRQASTEKDNLAKDLAQSKAENEKLQKELDKVKKTSDSKETLLNTQQNKLVELSEESLKKQKLLQQEIDENTKKNKELMTQNERLLEKIATQSSNFDVCYKNNKELYSINQEILGKYEDKGFWDALRQKEPLTAIARVKIENLVQDYQYKIDKLDVKVIPEKQTN